MVADSYENDHTKQYRTIILTKLKPKNQAH